MKRRAGFIAAWVVVTALSATVAAGAVGSVRDAVTDRPTPLATLAVPESTLGAPTSLGTTVAPTQTSTSTTSAPSTAAHSTTTVTPSTTTPTAPSTSSPPSTAPSTTVPPTTAPPTAQLETATYELIGGWVRIRYGGGDVFFVDAGAASGFNVEVRDTGPEEVEVRFRSADHESNFKAEYENGKLDISREEEGDDDDHD
jgi:hypothetical protein